MKGQKPEINPVIGHDILRYKKNKFGANLALGGLACGCIYFMFLYAVFNTNRKYGEDFFFYWKPANGQFGGWGIAFDVIYNLFFLLLVFLCSEQVKNYNRKLFIPQIVVGALQFARIFWHPFTGFKAGIVEPAKFVIMAIALAASGALIIASAIIGYLRSKEVEEFNKTIESGEVDIMAVVKELDEEDERAAAAAAEAVAAPEAAEAVAPAGNNEEVQ